MNCGNEMKMKRSWGHGFKPRWNPEFFSGFFTQLHKLRSLRRSFLHFQCYYLCNYVTGGLIKAVIHGSTFVAQQMLCSNEWNKAFLFSYNNVQSTFNTAWYTVLHLLNNSCNICCSPNVVILPNWNAVFYWTRTYHVMRIKPVLTP